MLFNATREPALTAVYWGGPRQMRKPSRESE